MTQSKVQKQKVLTVQQIKEIEPLSNVIQLSPYYSYIITVEKSNLVGGQERLAQKAQGILKVCNAAGIPAVVMAYDEGIKFWEFQQAKIKMPITEENKDGK